MAMPASPSAINPVKIAKARTVGDSARRLGGRYRYGLVAITPEQSEQAFAADEMQSADHHEVVAILIEQRLDFWKPLTIARAQQCVVELRRLFPFLQEFLFERVQVSRAPGGN